MDTISWDSVTWTDGGETIETACPACGAAGAKPVRLKVRSPWPPNPVQSLVVCDACGSATYPTLTQPPYEAVFDPLVACYLEQNAGVDSMAQVLAAVDPARVKGYLELGCGYGLLLDYARTMFGWRVRGFDPGFSAQEGRVALGVDISHTYLTSPADAGPEKPDLIFCSEVIEHVFDPLSLLTLLRETVAPGGAVMLTTPSAGGIHAGTRPGTLLSLLSPGYHFVLFSKQGMETILRRAGFTGVQVVDHGHSLQAAASVGPLNLDFARPYDRKLYRGYLERRIPTLDQATPLGLGYRYRLLKETVHAGDFGAARAAAADAAAAVRARWPHLDLTDPAAVLAWLQTTPPAGGVEDYHLSAPFNLCGVLYFHGMLAWQLDGQRETARRWFEAAAAAGDRMRAGLRVIGADDGETEELSWRARGLRAHLLATTDPAAAAEATLRLGSAVESALNESMPPDILADVTCKVFVDLVNLGHYVAAGRLAGAVAASLPTVIPGVRALALFASGMLALNHDKAPEIAAARFGQAHRVGAEINQANPQQRPEPLEWTALAYQARAQADGGDPKGAERTLDAMFAPGALERLCVHAPDALGAGLSSLANLDLDKARTKIDVITGHPDLSDDAKDQIRISFFKTATNKGQYNIASQMAGDIERSLPRDPQTLAEACYCLGIVNMNYRNAHKTAARWFGQCHEVSLNAYKNAQPLNTGLLWVGWYHQGLALTKAGDKKAAKALMQEFFTALGAPGLPEAPPAIIELAKKIR